MTQFIFPVVFDKTALVVAAKIVSNQIYIPVYPPAHRDTLLPPRLISKFIAVFQPYGQLVYLPGEPGQLEVSGNRLILLRIQFVKFAGCTYHCSACWQTCSKTH